MSVPFTSENSKYKTDTNMGYPHGDNNAKGSVTKTNLGENNGATLWFEYVIGVEDRNDKCYWFMWYDKNGKQLIGQSAVIDLEVLPDLLSKLKELKKI